MPARFWWLPFGKAPEISPLKLKEWLDEGRPVQIIDARTGLEYQQGSLPGALHAPVTGLPGSVNRLRLDRHRQVVVLCLSGHRSLPGTRLLRSQGYEAYSLKGGLLAWKAAGFSLDKRGE